MELDTGKAQSITITANEKMSDAEIEAAIKFAETYAAQDQIYRDGIDIIQEAHKVLNKAEAAMKKAGKQIEKEEKKQIKL